MLLHMYLESARVNIAMIGQQLDLLWLTIFIPAQVHLSHGNNGVFRDVDNIRILIIYRVAFRAKCDITLQTLTHTSKCVVFHLIVKNRLVNFTLVVTWKSQLNASILFLNPAKQVG